MGSSARTPPAAAQTATTRISRRIKGALSECEPQSQLCLERISRSVVLIILPLRIFQLTKGSQRRCGARAIGKCRARQLHVGKVGKVKEFRADRNFGFFIGKHEVLLNAQTDVLEAVIPEGISLEQYAVNDRAIRIL